MTTTAQNQELRLKKGDVIFRQGDTGQEMFVISAGRVRLVLGSQGHEKELRVLGPGEFFGELSLLGDAPRSATAMAAEDSTLLPIARDVFAMMVQDDLEIVFRMMNIQGQRLRDTNLPVQELTHRLGQVRIAAHALQRVAGAALPATVEVAGLAAELGLSTSVVEGTAAELAAQGAGAVQNGRWVFQSREPVDKLIAAICGYADGNR
ncbi:MAG: cyclic nucleotide-binding domain-containing protein [Deltaproteobacteria bacterium]|nr:cyclic nucleotide-binding domain-containing protein [Deltaproteobacteria bacterium]MBI3388457.1 cyclic nucleotide-binding domain-containing protein [Deltaproteobacteria bacterium]